MGFVADGNGGMYPPGTEILPDGTVIIGNGNIIYPPGTVIKPDGSVIKPAYRPPPAVVETYKPRPPLTQYNVPMDPNPWFWIPQAFFHGIDTWGKLGTGKPPPGIPWGSDNGYYPGGPPKK
jgi:hypothetical protein